MASLCLALVLALVGSSRQQDESRVTQKPAGESTAPQQNPGARSKEQESPQGAPTFRVRVNLVQVKVVVRDEKGQVVKGLQRDDFQIYDQGKLQSISTFGVETPESPRQRTQQGSITQTETVPASVEKT